MAKYSRNVDENLCKSVCARGNNLRVSFKNTTQTVAAIRGRTIIDAKNYLNAVLDHKRCIPFTRYNTGVGRTAQAKEFKLTQGRWPEKSIRYVLDLIKNCEANAKVKEIAIEDLIISHILVQRGRVNKRRTYRAHGRLSPYNKVTSHIEMICTKRQVQVPKAVDEDHKEIKLTARKNAARKLKVAA